MKEVVFLLAAHVFVFGLNIHRTLRFSERIILRNLSDNRLILLNYRISFNIPFNR